MYHSSISKFTIKGRKSGQIHDLRSQVVYFTLSTTMAPIPGDTLPVRPAPNNEQQYPAPLKLSGALDQHEFEETTPVIGREFPNVNIVDDILNAPNADELVRDLAITSKCSKSSWSIKY